MVQILKRMRPGAIFILAALIGATAVVMAPAAAKFTGVAPDSAAAVIIKTRTASCAGVAFWPNDSATTYVVFGYGERVRTSASGGQRFWCDPGLPNKATVTKVVFDVKDANVSLQVVGCGLTKIFVNASGAAMVDMAAVAGTGGMPAPGRVLLTDTPIIGNPTNNATTSYALWCDLDPEGMGAIGLFGASITYTISSGDG